MGIKKLSSELKTQNLVKTLDLSAYKGKKIAIDISILLYETVISIRNSGDDLRNKQGQVTSHILGLFNKTIWLLSNNITPIYVFDGKPPEIKRGVLNNRKKIRQKAEEKVNNATNEVDRIKYFKRTTFITNEQIQQCKELLEYMGIPYLQAEGEADCLLALLAKNNFVDAVYTEDMDILTFGSPVIVKYIFSKNKKIEEIKLQDILDKFDMSYERFVKYCIFLGCDYNPKVHNDLINHEKALYYSKLYINDYTTVFPKGFPSDWSIDKPFKYFTEQKLSQELEINLDKKLKPKKPHKNLIKLLVSQYGLIKQKVLWKVNLLNKLNS